MTTRASGSTPPRWMRIAVPVAALVVALGIGEGALRAVVRRPLPRVLPEIRYEPHPIRHFTLLPNQEAFTYGAPVRIDEAGFRAGPPGTQVSGGPAILALGDSFTFGLGVKDEETWPSQLQQRLAAAGLRDVNVVNGGTISYGLFHEVDVVRTKAAHLGPRLIVQALYWNDFMNPGPPAPNAPAILDALGYFTWDRLAEVRRGPAAIASTVVDASALLFTAKRMVGAGLAGRASRTTYSQAYVRLLEEGLAAEDWLTLERLYGELQAAAKQQGAGLAVVVMPVSGIVQRGGRVGDHPYAAEARRRFERLGIPVVDAFRIWDEQRLGAELFLPEPVDAHLNARGYRVVAEALSRKLLSDPALRKQISAGQ